MCKNGIFAEGAGRYARAQYHIRNLFVIVPITVLQPACSEIQVCGEVCDIKYSVCKSIIEYVDLTLLYSALVVSTVV